MSTQTTENTAGTHDHNFNRNIPERPGVLVCSCGLDNEQAREQEEAKNAEPTTDEVA
jgi:hypothetical protein